MLYSLSLLPAFFAAVYGQGGALPDQSTTTPEGAQVTACSGCYVVADIAQVVFGETQLTQTQTQVVSQGSGLNGSTITTTYNEPLGQFSFDPQGVLTGGVTGEYAFPQGTVITINGAALTSPTAYNVFTAYTVSSLVPSNGVCVTQTYATLLPSAYSVSIPPGAPASFIFEAESQFFSQLPQLTCAVGGAVVSSISAIPVSVTTTTSTTSGIFRPTPIAPSPAAASTTGSGSGSAPTTLSTASGNGTSSASQSITTGAGSIVQPTSFSPALFVAMFLLPGLGAFIL